MKKSILLISIIAFGTMTYFTQASEKRLPSTPSKSIIVFSSKAYWDGTTESCLPRDKGCCFHIGFTTIIIDGQISGEMTYTAQDGLVYSFNQKTGISRKTFEKLCNNGGFYLDGPGTISTEIINMLNLPKGYSIPAGNYSYRMDGDIVYVSFH